MNKRLIIQCLALAIVATSTLTACIKKGGSEIEVPEEKGPKWGFIDHSGKFIIKPQFRRVKRFTEGLAGADLNARWGFINDKGVFVIPRNYEDVKPFSAGYACVEMAGHWYVINKQGAVVWPGAPLATDIGFPHEVDPDAEDHAVVVPYFDEKQKKWGFHDFGPNGKGDIAPKWDKVKYFNDGLCPVFDSRVGKWGFCNNTGTIVIDYKFDDASAFKNRVAECMMGDDFVWVDKIGTIARKSRLESIHLFSDELALQQKRNKFIYIKRSGEPAFRKRFRFADNFSEGLAAVQPLKSSKRGFIDTAGELVIPDVFDDARGFSEQKAAVRVDPDHFFQEYNEDLTPKHPVKKEEGAEKTEAEKEGEEHKDGGTTSGAEAGEGGTGDKSGTTDGAKGEPAGEGKSDGTSGGKSDAAGSKSGGTGEKTGTKSGSEGSTSNAASKSAGSTKTDVSTGKAATPDANAKSKDGAKPAAGGAATAPGPGNSSSHGVRPSRDFNDVPDKEE